MKKNFKYSYIIDILFIVIILTACLWDVGSLQRIRVVDDGFCYWGIAATISGYDWTELISQSAYYSYGYSIILIPLFWLNRLGLSMVIIYRLAIVLNACFLTGCYLMALYMLRELFEDIPDGLKKIISLFVTLYIGNTAQMGLAWSEVFLCFMFWCVIVFLYKVIRKPGYGNIFGLVFTTTALLAIHMRTVGVVIAVGIVIVCFFIINRKEIGKKYIIYTSGFSVFFCGLVMMVQRYVTNQIYLGAAADAANSVQATLDNKVGKLVSVRGIADLAISVVGKIFYISSATFLLAVIGAFVAVFYIVGSFKKAEITGKREKWQLKEWMMTFLLLSFMAEIGIESIYKSIPFFRSSGALGLDDALTFGRYADFVLGPLIILGVWAIYHLKTHYKEVIFSLLIAIGSTGIVQLCYNVLAFRKGTDSVFFRLAASPWLYFLANGHKTDFASYVMLTSIGIFLVMCLIRLFSASKWHGLGIMLLVLTAVWTSLGVIGGIDYTASKQGKEKAVDTIAEIVRATGKETQIYMVGQPNTEVKILQWMLANRSIHTCNLEEMNDMDKNHAIILGNSSEIQTMSALDDQMDFLYDSGTISVFADPGNVYYKEIADKAEKMAHEADSTKNSIILSDVTTELSYTKMNGGLYYNYQAADGGYMTKEMGVKLEDGVYEFVIDMRVTECEADTEIGYITVGDASGNVQYTHKLNANDFIEKARQDISVLVETKDWSEPIIGVYTYGQAAIKINDISYQKKEGSVQLDSAEIEEIAVFLERQNEKKVYYIDSDKSGLTGFPWWEYGKLNYLSGQMIPFKEHFENAYYIVEKTDPSVTYFCQNNMQELLETESYVVFDIQ